MISEPLFHPGWIKFCTEFWGLSSQALILEPEKGNTWKLHTIIYKNSNNQLVMPARTPYIPVKFECETQHSSSYIRRKRAAFEQLAKYYKKNDCKGALSLSHEMDDPRPFIWQGYNVSPVYTYHLNIQKYKDDADKRVLRHSRNAEKKGYYIERTTDFELVVNCLEKSEERKNFSHMVDSKGLSRLNDLMTENNFQCYIAKNSRGDAVGARIILVADNFKVSAWSAGIDTQALHDGVNHFMIDKLLEKFQYEQYEVFDFVGANLPAVAAMKEGWGGELITSYSLRSPSFRNQLISNLKFIKSLISNS